MTILRDPSNICPVRGVPIGNPRIIMESAGKAGYASLSFRRESRRSGNHRAEKIAFSRAWATRWTLFMLLGMTRIVSSPDTVPNISG
jgi:hypothetical protein